MVVMKRYCLSEVILQVHCLIPGKSRMWTHTRSAFKSRGLIGERKRKEKSSLSCRERRAPEWVSGSMVKCTRFYRQA